MEEWKERRIVLIIAKKERIADQNLSMADSVWMDPSLFYSSTCTFPAVGR